MNLFDQLVANALAQQPELSSLKLVVEKEILHYDILRILSTHGFLDHLTFIGGTALRACYGGTRLSEDLDFTAHQKFSSQSFNEMGHVLTEELHKRYGLNVSVQAPKMRETNVDTWKIKIETRPEHKHLPAQCIHLDICLIPSYETRPMLLLNTYNIDLPTQGLLISTQSREEIYADKIIAFALRPNRIKHRDLWDIAWLFQQKVVPAYALIPKKLRDRHVPKDNFLSAFHTRLQSLNEKKIMQDFIFEMTRFLPPNTLEGSKLWAFLGYHMQDIHDQLQKIVD